jgi:hypothetical protein
VPARAIVTTFEAFHTESRFDMVYAAAAWHWTDRVTRWAKAVELLVPGGVLVLFGRPADLKDPDLSAAVEEIEKQVLPADDPAGMHSWSIEEMAAADGLTDVERRHLPSVTTATTEDYLGRLATTSAYLRLAPEQRAEALRLLRAALPDQVSVDTTVEVSLARRVESRG